MKLLILENGGVHGAYRYAVGSALAMGGSEKQEWLLARTLQQKYDVVIASPSPPQNPEDRIPRTTIEGVEFIPCAPRNRLRNVFDILKHVKPDWLYVRCATPYLGFWFLMAKLLDIRTIFACASDTNCQPWKALSLRRKRYWPLYAWGLRLSDRIFTQHAGQTGLLSSNLKKKAFQVNNIVEVPEIEKNLDSNYIAWVAGIRYEKRPDLLIEIAFQAPDVRFMVGGGIQAATISSHGNEFNKQIIEQFQTIPNITYLGNLSHARAIQLIANGRAFLTTSQREGFPNVLLEAWAVQTPVVSIGIDPGGVIRQHRMGLICSSIEEAATCLRQLIQAPNKNRQLVINGLHYVNHHHSAAVVLQQFESALNISE